MILAGDEVGRTQGGNNNAYCQDNEISWFDWDIDEEGQDLLAFTRQLIALRRDHIVFHRNRFFHGQVIPGTEVKDVVWLRADGVEMEGDDWKNGHAKALAVRLSGEAGLMHLSERGEQEPDDTFLLLINASQERVTFTLPADPAGARWEQLLNTAADMADEAAAKRYAAGRTCPVAGNSLHLLKMHGPQEV